LDGRLGATAAAGIRQSTSKRMDPITKGDQERPKCMLTTGPGRLALEQAGQFAVARMFLRAFSHAVKRSPERIMERHVKPPHHEQIRPTRGHRSARVANHVYFRKSFLV
jgi:hypothetical protein